MAVANKSKACDLSADWTTAGGPGSNASTFAPKGNVALPQTLGWAFSLDWAMAPPREAGLAG